MGLSGGKDSLALLWLLNERLARAPVDYQVTAIYIDPGFGADTAETLAQYCQEAGHPLRIEKTDFGIRGHSPENRENPCFLCSRLRRKRLFEVASDLGCRKLALGHNKDDIIETLFLNICYSGEISTMVPSQSFFKGLFTLIRPLAFADEDLIKRFVKEQNLPVVNNPCPSASRSKRQEIKKMLQGLYQSNRKVKGNIFHSLSHVKSEYLLKP